MSAGAVLLFAVACVALAVAAVVVLLVRRMPVAVHARVARDTSMPWTFRFAAPLSAMIEPLVESAVPSARLERISRRLDRLGISASMGPARWEANRIIHAAMLAGALVLIPGSISVWFVALAAAAGHAIPGLWLARSLRRQADHIMRELPGYLDLLTVAVEAGASLTSGIRMIVAEAPESPLRNYFDRVLREVRGGRPRAAAFSHVAGIFGAECLETLASALAHAEASGMSLGQVLRTQAEQRTAERFARAEQLAMQAPVKMLAPLILCIFPCTFIVLAVPIVARLREALVS